MNPAVPLIEWYQAEGRPLPWRETKDPYKIWISEIILQQTRVAQGLNYFIRFVDRFPTVEALAEASQDEVMKYWEGLGYYSRARNLHFSAKVVVNELGGVFPDHYTEWLKLKGVGPYTARAVGSFAFGNSTGVLDGNVFRVVSRYRADASPIDIPSTRKAFQALLDEWIAPVDPADFNQAMMDLGATVCTPRNPKCADCPIQTHCAANAKQSAHLYPVKSKKLKRKTRYFQFYLHEDQQGKLLIQKRPNKGIWAGLWEIPNSEMEPKAWKKAGKNTYLGDLKHVFTHFDMMIRVYRSSELPNNIVDEHSFVSREELTIFAFSRAVLKIFETFLPKV